MGRRSKPVAAMLTRPNASTLALKKSRNNSRRENFWSRHKYQSSTDKIYHGR